MTMNKNRRGRCTHLVVGNVGSSEEGGNDEEEKEDDDEEEKENDDEDEENDRSEEEDDDEEEEENDDEDEDEENDRIKLPKGCQYLDECLEGIVRDLKAGRKDLAEISVILKHILCCGSDDLPSFKLSSRTGKNIHNVTFLQELN